MRNGTKLKQLLLICDINIALDEGIMEITTINKYTYQKRSMQGPTFSAVLDKAYRQMLKDADSKLHEE